MNTAKLVLITAAVVWLQLASLPAIRPLGVVPNLALVVVLLLAVRLPVVTSLTIAVVIGWLLDSGAGSDYGLRITFYSMLVILVVFLRQQGSDLENLSLQASLVTAGTVLLNLAILANLAFHHVTLPLSYVGLKLLAEVICNLLLLFPVRWVLSAMIGGSNEMVVSVGGRRG